MISFLIEEPITYKKIEVPQYILKHCDLFTFNIERENLRYYDCVYMNMGYYGNPPLKPIFK